MKLERPPPCGWSTSHAVVPLGRSQHHIAISSCSMHPFQEQARESRNIYFRQQTHGTSEHSSCSFHLYFWLLDLGESLQGLLGSGNGLAVKEEGDAHCVALVRVDPTEFDHLAVGTFWMLMMCLKFKSLCLLRSCLVFSWRANNI